MSHRVVNTNPADHALREALRSPEELMTLQQVADQARVPIQTVHTWVQRYGLPAVRIGRYRRVIRKDFDEFIQHRKREQRF
ncbi:MAG: helix-turn-helix domain-containing protein [Actinomycetaceae bacterium]|nr:helix-turn-helix domain-containing protein [Actinomycetaceae bacterium]